MTPLLMTPLLMLGLTATMLVTAFLSGIFGMAGGLILMGVLLAVMPVPAAMALHAITQMASNGWRGWAVAASCPLARGRRLSGRLPGRAGGVVVDPLRAEQAAGAAVAGRHPVPDPAGAQEPEAEPRKRPAGAAYGVLCMTLMLLTGVTGPLLDRFFLGGGLERRQIVSTKAVCQVFGHFAKLLYFGGIVTQAGAVDPVLAGLAIAASVIGTTVSRYVLEAMSDQQYRVWANRLIASIGGYYILYGTYLLVLA
ncbi:MAG: TSUP family transporter [Pseudomonadota bacterium]